MPQTIRGADIVVRTLELAGCANLFTLSGNHIMSIFDAALGSSVRLLHVRHEAAAVHMADAWGRLTGQCGIALVSGGAGHANALAALVTAQAACSPVVLLSGHAGRKEIGRGAFQELRQAEMAAPVSKAAWTAHSLETLGRDIARAISTAQSGRPGPVHLSLPFDLLDEEVAFGPELLPRVNDLAARPQPLEPAAADAVLALLAAARQPLILGGPMLCHAEGPALLKTLAAATGVPSIGLESPRGLNDPALGLFAEVLGRADLILLIGKAPDFTLRFADTPFIAPSCNFVVIDPEPQIVARLAQEKGDRLLVQAIADPLPAAATLIACCRGPVGAPAWRREVAAALAYRPSSWAHLKAPGASGRLHPIELCRALVPHLKSDPKAVLICDGGEIGQWPQAVLVPPRRIINGVAGAIGASIPFALAARLAEASAPVIAVLGDGTFGFHMAEFDTAVRTGLPFVAVLGNDATWNAEYQLQVRNWGGARAHGCDLLPTRYDLVAAALGGHGEYVTAVEQLAPALARALASGKPACVNVTIERVPAPVYKREG
jgi:thiamine pyrophosphate-dependent acetolactate synthase large subunit-like protein